MARLFTPAVPIESTNVEANCGFRKRPAVFCAILCILFSLFAKGLRREQDRYSVLYWISPAAHRASDFVCPWLERAAAHRAPEPAKRVGRNRESHRFSLAYRASSKQACRWPCRSGAELHSQRHDTMNG